MLYQVIQSAEVDMVEVKNLNVVFSGTNGQLEALRNVTFSLPKGSISAIIGPSGCGKSTLLYVLAGLNQVYSGEVLVAGAAPAPGRRETALILQDYGLLPWKTVYENTTLGLAIRGMPSPLRQRKGEAVLRELGLWELRKLYPSQLSGGQRQRVAIARSLTLEPDLLLMDEPFSSLDALTREALQDALLEIWLHGRATVVLVTHSIEEAVFLGQQVVVMSRRPGQIVDLVQNPLAGRLDSRKRPEFHQLATRLREALEKA